MSGFIRDLLASINERRRLWRGDDNGALAPGRLIELAEALLSGRGEASGVVIAAELLDLYRRLDEPAKLAFFEELAQNFGPDDERLRRAAARYLETADAKAAAELQTASEPARQELFRRLNLAPGGTVRLVRMREDVLGLLRNHPSLATVDADLAHLFSSWFNRGFLVMRRIDWQTPAATLEKIIRYEAVHRFDDWEDLRRRIDLPDRRLYAFFHPALDDEPLIFVQVALTTDIPDAIAPILSGDREPISGEEATAAVFYAITNTREGLRGISFGNFLIKQVVEDLAREFPGLKRFVTLSPAPRFRKWLEDEIAEGSALANGLSADELTSGSWQDDPLRIDALAEPIKNLAAHYFMKARDGSGRLIDPVARFHLGNGARLERINWPADLSEKGLAQSFGLMVNYLYELKTIEQNHEAYANEGRVIASPAVSRRLRAATSAAASTPPITLPEV